MLPSDPTFRALTPELIKWLYESKADAEWMEADALSGRSETPTHSDPEFDQWETAVDAEERNALTDDQKQLLRKTDWDEEYSLA